MVRCDDGTGTRNKRGKGTLSDLSAALQVYPVLPSEDSQSLFDPSAVLPAGRPVDTCSPPAFHFKSHILPSRTQRSSPLVPVEFHMQKSAKLVRSFEYAETLR